MKNVAAISTPHACLPERDILRVYPKENWLVIGHLTHAKPTSATTQLQHFRQMMQALGYVHREDLHCVVLGSKNKPHHQPYPGPLWANCRPVHG